MKKRIDIRCVVLLLAFLFSGFPTTPAWGYDMGGGGSFHGGFFSRRPFFPGGGFHQVPRGTAPETPALPGTPPTAVPTPAPSVDAQLRALTTDFYAGRITLEEYRVRKQALLTQPPP